MTDFTVCAVDVGTSMIKAAVYGGDRQPLGYAAVDVPRQRANGHLDVDPEQLWESFTAAVRASTAQAGVSPSRVAIASQMAGLVLLDDERAVIGHPIVGIDHRTGPSQPLRVAGVAGSLVHTSAKIAWVAINRPGDLQRARWIGGIKELLIQRLTGRWITDPSTASVTGLYDLKSHAWDAVATRRSGVDVEQLPEIIAPTHEAGVVRLPAEFTGLAPGAIALGGVGDGPAANLACGAIGPSRLCLSMGTTLVVRSLVHCVVPPSATSQLPAFVQHVCGEWYCVGIRTEWDGTGTKLTSVDAPGCSVTLAELPDIALALAENFGVVDELYPVGGRSYATDLQLLADQWGLTVCATAARDGTLGAAGLCWSGQDWPQHAAGAAVIRRLRPAARRTPAGEDSDDRND